MGFLNPDVPAFDVNEWRARPHLQRIKPLAQHWVEHGFGTPYAIYLLYLLKVAVWAAGGAAIIATTPGLGGLAQVGSWWSELVVYQKVVVWTLLWEVLGLGCGSGPLTLRFLPPVGGFLHWLRLGTVRLPPWPRIPLTMGSRRNIVDVALYLAVLVGAMLVLLSPGQDGRVPPGGTVGLIDPVRLIPLAASLAVLGLRDKTIFLAARGEQYWLTLLVFAFPFVDMVVGLKVVMVALWWGAAASKLTRHFPYAVAVMLSNSPLHRVKWLRRRLYQDHPDNLQPSSLSRRAAYAGTAVEFVLPAVLLCSGGGPLTMLALAGMVAFHAHIFATFPMGAPLEWNVFFIYSSIVLFGHYAAITVVTAFSAHTPILVLLLAAYLVGIGVLGNTHPHLVSFLPAMRYYAGNWATSLWCFRDGADAKLDRRITKASPTTRVQLTKLYDEPMADLLLDQAMAWRCLHLHGRALTGLLPRALPDVAAYAIREGEFIAGVVLGWNFGDGHLHDESLLAAIKRRCHFEAGELRVIMLEAQPIHRQRQRYRIIDAATGLVERGHVAVADMASRQPWLDDDGTIPVHGVRRDGSLAVASRKS